MEKTPQLVEIGLLEELVERSHAYLWHFAMVYEKESARLKGESETESWNVIKHQKQKLIYRQCLNYCDIEVNHSLGKLWKARARSLYANADFDGLMQFRQHIEAKSFTAEGYMQLLKTRHKELQDEISKLREDTRRVRVDMIREKHVTAARMSES